MEKKLLKITCKQDKSSYQVKDSKATCSYFCLLDLDDVPINVTDFTEELNNQTRLNWVYKQICGCGERYVLTVINEFDKDQVIPEEVTFHIRTLIIPKQKRFIEEIK